MRWLEHSESFGMIPEVKIRQRARLMETHMFNIDRIQLVIMRYHCKRFLKCQTIILAGNDCRNCISNRMITETFRNIPECFGMFRPIIFSENGYYHKKLNLKKWYSSGLTGVFPVYISTVDLYINIHYKGGHIYGQLCSDLAEQCVNITIGYVPGQWQGRRWPLRTR